MKNLNFTDKLLLVVGAAIIGWLLFGPRFTINFTDSIPEGLYLVTNGGAGRGDYTIITDHAILKRARERGYLEKGVFIGKKIGGIPGDTVIETRRGVFINGRKIPFSKPLHRDSQGRRLYPVYACYLLGAGQYFLISENPRGYDSRYFGPVPQSGLRYHLYRVITFN
jgi:conjugative transfer signal peptidase TraF